MSLMSDTNVHRLDNGIVRVDFGAHPVLTLPVLLAAFERLVAS